MEAGGMNTSEQDKLIADVRAAIANEKDAEAELAAIRANEKAAWERVRAAESRTTDAYDALNRWLRQS